MTKFSMHVPREMLGGSGEKGMSENLERRAAEYGEWLCDRGIIAPAGRGKINKLLLELLTASEAEARETIARLEGDVLRLSRPNPEYDKDGKLYADFCADPKKTETMGGLEPAIIDALARGCVHAWPGDGVGCVANMIWAALDRAERAEVENARLREALEFYATTRHYERLGFDEDGYQMKSNMEADAGDQAKAALKGEAE